MTTIGRNHKTTKSLVASIARGLNRMFSSPTERMEAVRRELEREEGVRQHRVEVRSRETRETLEMAARYLRNLPSS